MRGHVDSQPAMFFAIDLDSRIRRNHPLRPIKKGVDLILSEMSEHFDRAYAHRGRPGVPPEVLLKLMLLQGLYGIASEAQLIERLETDLLFRWFCGLDPAEDTPDATAFSHNRQRFIDHDLTGVFFAAVTQRVIDRQLVSKDPFSVDGTLFQSHASMKSVLPNEQADALEKKERSENNDSPNDSSGDSSGGFMPRNPSVDFRGQKRTNQTHRSVVDPDAKLYRKSQGSPSVLGHLGHILVDNRNGIIVGLKLSEANGTAEREAALAMLDDLKARHQIDPKTLGADAGYDAGAFMMGLAKRGVTPHIAMARDARPGGKGRRQKSDRPLIAARLLNDRRKLRDPGYAISQRKRKKVEEPFGWLKAFAGLGKARLIGRDKIQQQWQMAASALTLIRMRNLLMD